VDGDGVAGHARGGERPDVDGAQIEVIAAAAARADEVARELRRDVAAAPARRSSSPATPT
jgi:hypothetical protein